MLTAEEKKIPKVEVTEREALLASMNIVHAPRTKVCDVCKKYYGDHPFISNIRDGTGTPYLRKICNGKFAKLTVEEKEATA